MSDLIDRNALHRIICAACAERPLCTDYQCIHAWIPCSEKRPDCFGEYLTYNAVTGKMLVLSFSPEYNSFGIYDCEVSHWMPLPDPPEVE